MAAPWIGGSRSHEVKHLSALINAIEEEIEFPEIADALGQAAMAVSVGVD
jgi:hypothetical protein